MRVPERTGRQIGKMRARVSPARYLLLMATLLGVVVAGISRTEGAQRAESPPPAIGSARPVVTGGPLPGVVWLDDTGAMPRVTAAVPPGAPAVVLGPGGEGADGHPTAVADPRGLVRVAAARATAAGSTVWAQAGGRDGWRAPEALPRATTWDEMPTLGLGPDGGAWIAWRGYEEGGSARLYAAARRAGAWRSPTMLPMATGEPGAPAIAVDDAGRPVVVWTASDGGDAEVWTTRWLDDRWTAPARLSSNAVPDTLPTVVALGGETLVAWSSYTPEGYVAVARTVSAEGRVGPTRRLSRGQGIAPRVLGGLADPSPPLAMWSRPRGTGQVVEGAFYEAGTWSEPGVLATLPGTALSAGVRDSGGLLLAWNEAGRLGLARGRVEGDTSGRPRLDLENGPGRDAALEAAAPPVTQQEEPGIPRRYLAFGDSQTEGIVKLPNKIILTPGYPPLLDAMLDDLIGTASVPNRGIGGEITVEGLGRIASEIDDHSPDAVLIMEGTNDITRKIDTETIAFNLRRMVERSQAQGALTFLAALMPRGEFGFGGPANERTRRLNEEIQVIVDDTGAILVDMFEPFLGHGGLYSNPTHPNDEGYTVMAEVWFEHMRPEIIARTNRGDFDGSGRVDGWDLVRLALAFGSERGEERYRRAADVNRDDLVDGFDLSILAQFFGQTLDGDGSDGGQ